MDDVDRAKDLEVAARQRAIDQVVHRCQETPLLNDDYQRICLDCGTLIPMPRLLVMPHAVRCVACQQNLETGR